jgi:hypothetical protein
MLQATGCDGCTLDAFTRGEDGRGQVAQALVIADVVIVLDEGINLPFKIAGQVAVFEQNAVLQGLVPSLDLSLSLGVIRCPAHCSLCVPRTLSELLT